MDATVKTSSLMEKKSTILPHDNLETYSLVWLDASVNSIQNIAAQQKIRASINYLITFEQSDQCEQHVRSVSEQDRIILIVSNELGQHLVPRIHQLRHVSSIYIYDTVKQASHLWANQFCKVNLISALRKRREF